MNRHRGAFVRVMAICALGTLAVVGWLLTRDRASFLAFVSADDTASYTDVVTHLRLTGQVLPSVRTLGYPLFLALTDLAAGTTHGPRLAIVVQLFLNLVAAGVLWRAMARL